MAVSSFSFRALGLARRLEMLVYWTAEMQRHVVYDY